MNQAPLRFIQISDTHIFSDKNKTLLGVPTQNSFEAVLELIKQEAGRFDFIIHSGDLAQDYSKNAYTRLAEMLEPFNVPVYCIPGNHDDPEIMSQVYPYRSISNDKQIITKNWQIILLDSHKPGSVDGYLRPDELKYLQHCLYRYPELHAIVIFHHQPLAVGCRWLDNLGLTNANELWDIITLFPKLKTILFGHVHQQYEQELNGIKCYSTPSTCFQFKRKQDHFGIEKLPPGFRWVNLHDDGHIETAVIRTEQYIGEFDEKSKGY